MCGLRTGENEKYQPRGYKICNPCQTWVERVFVRKVRGLSSIEFEFDFLGWKMLPK